MRKILACWGFCGAALVALTGCELIAAVDHDLIDQGGGGSGTGGTPTTGGGGSGGTPTTGGGGMGGAGGAEGGGGMGPECDGPEDCPAPLECQLATCVGGECGTDNEAAETLCDLAATDDGVCDGAGECVECIDNDQCTSPATCDTVANVCVQPHCLNGVQDADETGLNCGGNDCAPCGNGLGCVDADDCSSGFCDTAQDPDVCAACTTDSQCDNAEWCDAGVCTADKTQGQACNADAAGSPASECATGFCEETSNGFVCCDTDCEGACRSCLAADTGGTTGECGNAGAGQDPRDECADSECTTGVCVAGGSCGNEAAGFDCGTGPECAGDDLKAQDECNGSGTCVAPAAMDCPNNYNCDAASDACFTTCDDQTDCGDVAYCILGAAQGTMMTCAAKKADTDPCDETFECISGVCTANACVGP
ncbi:MAG: hypothetical protein IPM79_38815 [Polyangiaceae bacterium]|jgi:hypothetical protein|nr:hypothetical protein [Polyangiaceae bacterium]